MVQPKTRNRIVDTLMILAAERRWDDVTLEAIAERAGVTMPALRSAFDGRADILATFYRRIDEQVLAAADPDMAEEAPRERLFDVLFARIEALAPHRAAIRGLDRAARRDPLLALALNRIAVVSMGWMMAAAGISASGGRGTLRAQGLAVLWAQVLRVWLEDDDPGLARTMAALDRRLRQGERGLLRLRRLRRMVRDLRPGRRRPDAAPAGVDDEAGAAEGHPS